MDDLIAFLAARLDEDEAAAKDAAGDSGPEWNCHPEGLRGGIVVGGDEIVVYDEGRPAEAEAEHIARHDPAQVLREVAAKRAILDVAARAQEWANETAGATAGYANMVASHPLRHLAAVYSGHPDYRPEWKP